MPVTHSLLLSRPSSGKLPPAAPLPRALQTLACRLWPLGYLERCRARCGDPFTVHPVDMPPLVFCSDPQAIQAILTAPAHVLHPGAGGAVVAPLFGTESFTLLEEEAHMCGRRATQPTFRREAIQRHADAVVETITRESALLPLDRPVPLHPHLRALTLRVLLGTVCTLPDTCAELPEQLLAMLTVMAGLLLQEPRLRHLPGWRAAWRRFERRRRTVDESIHALLAGRRGCAPGAGGDLLDALCAARNPDGSPASAAQVRDNLVSVLIAGHETAAAQLAWAFQLLAHHPLAQRRLIEELDGGDGEEYLTATLHEVMRHRPVFLFASPRAVVQPFELGGVTYHPPVRLLACNYLAHHDPALYPDPHVFRPERFLGAAPNPRTWLPWGGGRRRCLGQHLAMLEMRAVLRAVFATRTVQAARGRMERARWRTVMVAPHAGCRVVLRDRRRAGRARKVTQTPASPTGHLFHSER